MNIRAWVLCWAVCALCFGTERASGHAADKSHNHHHHHHHHQHGSTEEHARCAVEDMDQETLARVEEDKKHWEQEHSKQKQNGRSMKTFGDGQTFNIPVSFHIIHDGSSGQVSSGVVQDQIQVLNETFVDFDFELRELTYHDNSYWYNNCYFADEIYKSSIRASLGNVIEPHVLHVYVCSSGFWPWSYLGRATFPYWAQTEPFLDGVICSTGTLPGQGMQGADLGHTAIHEVGHWLGLYHTFQGGCDEGDMVDDTPAESSPAYGCASLTRDTCPNDPGYDPVRNYMNYGDDVCMTEFTPGQEERMLFAYQFYRSQNYTAASPKPNDVCLNATAVAVGDGAVGDSFGATFDEASLGNANTSLCSGFASDDSPGLWYKIRGDGRTISFSVCNDVLDFDAQVAVFRGPCDQLVCLSHTRSCAPAEIIDTGVDQDYFILVNDHVGLTGNFLLEIESDETLSPQPSNGPTVSNQPSVSPSLYPSSVPTISTQPTVSLVPSNAPSISSQPSNHPSSVPSWSPTDEPSSNPSSPPSSVPSANPTISSRPSSSPSLDPSSAPTSSSRPTAFSVCSGAFESLVAGPGVRSLPLSDDDTELVTLPFDFPWMDGQTRRTLRVSSNAQININSNHTSSGCCSARWIDGNGPPRIALSQEDLDPSRGGVVLVKETTDSVVVSFQNVPFYSFSGTSFSFANVQAELFPTGAVSICFGAGDSLGNSFATGVEDPDYGFSAAEYLDYFDSNGISRTWPTGYCFCWNGAPASLFSSGSSSAPTGPPSLPPSPEPSSAPTEPPSLPPSLEPSSSGSRAFHIRVEILFDKKAEEISWTLTDDANNRAVLASGHGAVEQNEQLVSWVALLDAGGPYSFTINDSAGNGLCCDNGSGQYLVRRESVINSVDAAASAERRSVIASGGSFGYQATTTFRLETDGSATTVTAKPTPTRKPPTPSPTISTDLNQASSSSNNGDSGGDGNGNTIIFVVVAAVGVLVLGAAAVWVLLVRKRSRSSDTKQNSVFAASNKPESLPSLRPGLPSGDEGGDSTGAAPGTTFSDSGGSSDEEGCSAEVPVGTAATGTAEQCPNDAEDPAAHPAPPAETPSSEKDSYDASSSLWSVLESLGLGGQRLSFAPTTDPETEQGKR